MSTDGLITKPWARDLFTWTAAHAIEGADPRTQNLIRRFWRDSCAAHASGCDTLAAEHRTVTATDDAAEIAGLDAAAKANATDDDNDDGDELATATTTTTTTNNNNARDIKLDGAISATKFTSSGLPTNHAEAATSNTSSSAQNHQKLNHLHKQSKSAPSHKMQHKLSAFIEDLEFKIRLQKAKDDGATADATHARPHKLFDYARLLALTAKNTSLWLYASCFTTAHRLWLTPNDFRLVMKLRLGLMIGPSRACARCHTKASDPFGRHSLSCLNGGDKTLLHSKVGDLVFQLAASIGAGPIREPHPLPSDSNCRLDIQFALPQARGKPWLVDVAVTNCLAEFHMTPADIGPNAAATA